MILKQLLNFNIKILFILIISFTSSLSIAQTSENLFKTANTLYQKGDYQKALDAYKQIESKQLASVGLYFNMGNANYKLNQVAPAIYYFEKALLLDPVNTDILHNLTFAQRMAIDNIEVLPQSFLQRLDKRYIKILRFDTWALIAVSASILFVFLFLSYYFSFNSTRKRLYFITALSILIIAVFSFAFAYTGFNYTENNKPAIIFVQRASIKDAPTPNANEAFELHEGTKVLILEQVDIWQKIKLADGKIGWIIKTDLKAL